MTARAAPAEPNQTELASTPTRETPRETSPKKSKYWLPDRDPKVDWVEAARRIADGEPYDRVARDLEQPLQSFIDAMTKDGVMAFLVSLLRDKSGKLNHGERLRILRDVVFSKLEGHVYGGSERFTLWLAERMKVYDLHGPGATADDVVRMLSELTPAERAELATQGGPVVEETEG